ncbi:NfeD family protein [Mesomycoplasma lagogenitalium]|uniref:NfeD family protein n=1 Tax=Mesomycoplasma lagogenitalium TaxID=171286 RepID=A0ABY8LUV5_9BACT|nr:NfeD family protein [Mesomycoplasma lagogenitalium]WGI36328.1 NfeD family protein [Mesomycoplasma lagogenitalium]
MQDQLILKWTFFSIWIAIILIFIIIELFTSGIWSGLTSLSAIPSAIFSIFLQGQWWAILIQVLLFLVLWVLIYFSLYKFLKSKLKATKENINRLKGFVNGEKYKLVEDSYEFQESENSFGKIKIDGKYYRTLSNEGQGKIEKDSWVIIKQVKGNILYIERG